MSSDDPAIVVWLRQDLRLQDNPALHAAAMSGLPVVPLFILEPAARWSPGAASRYWLHQSLGALSGALEKCRSRLVLMQGDARRCFDALLHDGGIAAVYWNRRYEPAARASDAELKTWLAARCDVSSFNGRLLCEPQEIRTRAGAPYRVFTPFYRALREQVATAAPLPAPGTLRAPARWPRGVELDELGLQPGIDWADGIRAHWRFGEAGAHERLEAFIDENLDAYQQARDLPASTGVSRLSPHLAFGEISPRSIHYRLEAVVDERRHTVSNDAIEAWRRQLCWREFAYHLLFHFPHTVEQPLREAFNEMPWRDDPDALRAWQQGCTGIPLVDAGMRELWRTGFMHNRVRMIAASFLTKHLGIHWLEGARWFWDTLVDADLANNTLGWQWVAGCGADAAPYFRVFNPHTQGTRFDPGGAYVRRWIEAIAAADPADPHAPGAGDYQQPLIDLAAGRSKALERYERVRRAR